MPRQSVRGGAFAGTIQVANGRPELGGEPARQTPAVWPIDLGGPPLLRGQRLWHRLRGDAIGMCFTLRRSLETRSSGT